MIDRDAVKMMHARLSEARRILIFCHRNPDGDAIGSLVGLSLLLRQQYPGLPVLLYCKDPAPETFAFLPETRRMEKDPQVQLGDVLIFVDCAVPKQTDYHESHPSLFAPGATSINLDHHPDNSRYASVNIVDDTACSVCAMLVEIASILDWKIGSEVATCLLTGVYTDTGGLVHSNTNAVVYRTVAELLRAGARQQEIVKEVFRTARLSTLRLWGRVLEKISLTEEGGAISAVTQGDFRATGADASELTGAIDYVNAIPGMRFSLILSERDGKVKGSIRTLRDDVDVSAMASKFHGGGHRKAAGFALPGKLKQEVRWKVVEDEKA